MLGVINQVLLVRMGRFRERLVTDTQLELLESLSPLPTLSPRQGPKTRPILEESVSPILKWSWVTIRGSVALAKSYTQSEWALLTLRARAWKVMIGLAQISGSRSPPQAAACSPAQRVIWRVCGVPRWGRQRAPQTEQGSEVGAPREAASLTGPPLRVRESGFQGARIPGVR